MIAMMQPGGKDTASIEVDGPIPSTFSTTRAIVKVHTPGFRIGHKNQFVFCGGDPVNCRDPFGLAQMRQQDAVEGMSRGTAALGAPMAYIGLILAYPVALTGGLIGEAVILPARPFVNDLPSPLIGMHRAYGVAFRGIREGMRNPA